MHNSHLKALVFLLLLPLISNAKLPSKRIVPKVDFGIKFGGNFDNMNGKEWNNTYHSGFHGGAFLGFRENVFGIQGEALVNFARYTYGTSTDVKNLCLDIPVLFQIKLVSRLWLQLGPQYSFLLSSKYATADKSTDLFKPGAFSGVVGAQIILPLNFTIGARYIFGMSTWNNITSSAWKERATQLYIGFRLF